MAVSVAGDGVFIAAAPLLASTLTPDPLAISAVSAAFYLPWLALGLPAGALADRWPRRRVLMIADLVRAALIGLLVAALALGWGSMPLLIAVVFAVGVAQCFFDAASQAVIPMIVGRDGDDLSKVNGRYWALDTTGRSLVGPPLGSLTFSLGRALPFAIDAVSFLASAALVRMLPDLRSEQPTRQPLWASIRQGMHHLIRTPDLRVLAVAMGVFNFGYFMVMGTFVLYAQRTLHIPNAAYGALLAAMAVGGIVSATNARRLIAGTTYRKVQAVAMAVQAAVWLVAVLVANVWVTAALFVVYGAAASLASVAVGSARQALSPDGLIGRVVAAFRILGLGGSGLGALVGGAVAKLYGLGAPFAVSAVVLAVAAWFTWPSKRRPSQASDHDEARSSALT
ncbi:MFS transporter [Micromonospora sp. NPDC049240]|uniref:MFS transporter n=1 Tax=Micromonospora sp. NPDC049240 TaxID=3155151 RepID=UPI0033C1B5ED